MDLKRPPVGIDDFAKIREQNFYYVDKTGMLRELLQNWGEVNLFTRPRRFGKSLTMSMFRHFFEIGTDPALFDGLAISGEAELCREYMGRYPVISISLKGVEGRDFGDARKAMWSCVSREARRIARPLNRERAGQDETAHLRELCDGTGSLEDSLLTLSEILYGCYGRKVIILIDEYDVPLQKAQIRGYYQDMLLLIRQMFGNGMKTNEYLMFAVVTGCLRVSKESIFTGFNNPRVYTIVDEKYDEWFGFTDEEVRLMLDYYDLGDYYGTTKEWYDGYLFGNTHVYCPWDVINWCDQLRATSDRTPQNYWANTSGNDMVLRFVEMADETTKAELEELSEGCSVDKEIRMDLTYTELENNIDNLWSILFTTGYLTHCGRNEDGTYRLVIPNREIRTIFGRQVKDWFFAKIEGGMQELYQAFDDGDAEAVESCLNACLGESISFMDGGNNAEQRESFYHGFLLGILRGRRGWRVKSNREAGGGRADIILVDRFRGCGHIVEVKCADDESDLERKVREALRQISRKNYDEYFLDFDVRQIRRFGIAFYRKRCRVGMETDESR